MSDSVRKFEKRRSLYLCVRVSAWVCVSVGKGKDKKGNV